MIPYIIRIAIDLRAYELDFFSESKRPVEILIGKLWPWYGSFAEATATIKSRSTQCKHFLLCVY